MIIILYKDHCTLLIHMIDISVPYMHVMHHDPKHINLLHNFYNTIRKKLNTIHNVKA